MEAAVGAKRSTLQVTEQQRPSRNSGNLLSEVPVINSFDRETVASEVLRSLLKILGSGKVKPGERLPSERQLAAAFGVGRSAVREAVKTLALQGVVAIRQGDGMYLRRDSPEVLPHLIEWGMLFGESQILDLVEARQHIETIVARLAAERATTESVVELKNLLDALEKSFDDGDEAGFIKADLAFHAKVYEVASNSVLTGVLHNAQSLLQAWVRRVVANTGIRNESFLEHVQVFAAIEKRDPDAAAAAMSNHMASARERLLASLSNMPEPPVDRAISALSEAR